MKSVLNSHWKDWCWSWNFCTVATWCEELIHWKRPGCWERLKARRKGDDRGWDGWMASPTRWMWVWVNSGSWWWTGRPDVLRSWGRKESDTTEQLNWSDTILAMERWSVYLDSKVVKKGIFWNQENLKTHSQSSDWSEWINVVSQDFNLKENDHGIDGWQNSRKQQTPEWRSRVQFGLHLTCVTCRAII